MAEEKQKVKQEIPVMRGTFAIRGIVTAFNKEEGFNKQTKTGKGMRKIVFDVSSNEGSSHRMQIQAFQSDKVYYSGRPEGSNPDDKPVIKEVLWADRLKFKDKGFAPIDRVSFGLQKVKNEETGKDENKTESMLTYDAIEKIFELLNVGDSIYIRGNIQVEEYSTQSGEKRNATRFVPNQIYLTQEPIDFNAENFKETAMFELQAIAEEIETIGSKEVAITGLFIGNQRLGRQTLVFKEDPSQPEDFDIEKWMNVCNNFKRAPKYLSATFFGNIVSSAVAETSSSASEEVDEWGIPVKSQSPMRRTATGRTRQFICSGVVAGSPDTETYTEENVDTFITQFINPKSEFGEVASADDFAF